MKMMCYGCGLMKIIGKRDGMQEIKRVGMEVGTSERSVGEGICCVR